MSASTDLDHRHHHNPPNSPSTSRTTTNTMSETASNDFSVRTVQSSEGEATDNSQTTAATAASTMTQNSELNRLNSENPENSRTSDPVPVICSNIINNNNNNNNNNNTPHVEGEGERDERLCLTPTTDDSKIPQLKSPPPAPKKRRVRDEEISCKKKLMSEFDRVTVLKINADDLERIFRPTNPNLEQDRSNIRRKVVSPSS